MDDRFLPSAASPNEPAKLLLAQLELTPRRADSSRGGG